MTPIMRVAHYVAVTVALAIGLIFLLGITAQIDYVHHSPAFGYAVIDSALKSGALPLPIVRVADDDPQVNESNANKSPNTIYEEMLRQGNYCHHHDCGGEKLQKLFDQCLMHHKAVICHRRFE